MAFLELKTRKGERFMIDFVSGWEVRDRGEYAAMWVHYEQARNLDCGETYEALRAKLLPEPPETAEVLAIREQADDWALQQERERWRGKVQFHLSRTTMSVYSTQPECKAARDALQRLLDDLV